MTNVFLLNSSTIKATIYLLFLTTTFLIANSARILDEVEQQPQVIDNNLPQPLASAIPTVTTTGPIATPQVSPTTTLPSGQTPTDTNIDEEANVVDPPEPEPIAPAEVQNQPQPEAEVPTTTNPNETPVIVGKEPSLSFFMHDILGGSHPSARVVAGIVANTDLTGLPFSTLNNNLFPITGGIPLVNPKLNGIITNNNLPNLVGLGGSQSSTVFQNRGTGNVVTGGNNQPFVSAGNLPAGFTIQKLMFGSVTVIDDQLTEGHELGSAVIGRAQGFYLASSLDGSSQSIVVTVLLHGADGEHHDHVVEDTISLFGVHRTASHESEVAVIGGTGKYENARGYAALDTLLQEDQHTTDGVDTILHFNVFLTQ
ncbi:PREDICTED: dirigent protein 24 [Lupinus angustifolius]|uniref:dirigent protein 24 n=1 Tax=Lupinus angustifolius TaxID=3871 RepID=UPI00092E832B|nr:PREDICTED: dirigent protein 24 [Lupinus angustifolius]